MSLALTARSFPVLLSPNSAMSGRADAIWLVVKTPVRRVARLSKIEVSTWLKKAHLAYIRSNNR